MKMVTLVFVVVVAPQSCPHSNVDIFSNADDYSTDRSRVIEEVLIPISVLVTNSGGRLEVLENRPQMRRR
jgi:hypothetical protein